MESVDVTGIGMTSQRTRDRLIRQLEKQGITDEAVLSVMRRIPRHLFVDEALSHKAYENNALPIGYSQTISQPYIVAQMTQSLLSGGELETVLEVGTGSGYQTAILSQLVKRVYSVERIKALQNKARERLTQLKCRNVAFRWNDGAQGWNEFAPYDGILVSAAARLVPDALRQQLKIGGRMVIPVGDAKQSLRLITRTETGFDETAIENVRFVPLIGGAV